MNYVVPAQGADLHPVNSRVRKMREELQDTLDSFLLRSQNQITRLSHHVRGITMREFADVYNGSMEDAIRGVAAKKLQEAKLNDPDLLTAVGSKR